MRSAAARSPLQSGVRRCARLVLLLAVAATPVAARDKLEPPDLDRYLRWGPLRVRPGVELSNIGYDDNILFATGNGERIGDYTATISPKVDGVTLFGHSAFLEYDAKVDLTFYKDNSDQNYSNQNGSARLTVPLGRFGVFGEIEAANVKWRPVEREDIRPEEQRRKVGGGVIFETGWRTTLELGLTTSDLSYSDPDDPGGVLPGSTTIGDRLDRTEDAARLQVDYRLAGRTSLLLDTTVKDIAFDVDNSPGNIPDGRDTTEHRTMVGLGFGEGGTLSGTIKIGRGTIRARDSLIPDLVETIGEAELAYRLSPRTRLQADGERVPGFSVYGDTSYYLRSEYGLRVVHYLNRLYGIESGASRGRLTFPGTTGAARVDDLRRYDVGLRLRLFQNDIGRRVEYRIKLGRYRRISSVSAFDQAQTTFGVNAVLGF